VRRTAERQVAGDESPIDDSDIPPLTDERLAAVTRFRDARVIVTSAMERRPPVRQKLAPKSTGRR
jgi:hypothetical protein